MAQPERMVNILLKTNITKRWLSKMLLIVCIFMLLTPSNVYASHSWQRFSQYDPIVSSLPFNHPSNSNNNNNNKQSSNGNNNNNNNNNINNNDGGKLQNTGSVKHFNYRHIALGSQSNARQGSWKKWIPQASPLSSSSGSILYSPSSISSPSSSSSSSSSSLYPPYNSVYRSRQHNNNINNDLHDNNCSRFERNCHECRRHDCSFLQCRGSELPSTICLNVASPAFFTKPSIHKVLSQCHFIEQCPPSSQLSSKWMDSAGDGDTQSLISGSVSGSLPAPSNLVLSLYPSSQSSAGNSDSYSQRNPFTTADEFEDSKATKPNNNKDSALPYYYNSSSFASLSSPSSSSSSSSLLSPSSASDPKDLSYSLTGSGDNEFGVQSATSRSHSSLEKRQKNQQIQNRKRVAMHRYSQPWRHNDVAGDSILASALVADDSARRNRITSLRNNIVNSQHSSPSSPSSFSASSTSGPVHIGIGTIIALMLCSSLVISAVLTVAYKKISKIYRNNHSRSYGVLQEE